MGDAFKAIADPVRRGLLDRLYRRNGQSLAELCAGLEMTRFGVMKHLGILEAAGLVSARRAGREKLHYLNPVPIRLIHDRWVSKFTEPVAAALAQLKYSLEDTVMTGNAANAAPNERTVQLYEIFIRTTPEALWQAITDSAFSMRYPFYMAVDSGSAVGGPMRYLSDDGTPVVDGEILEIDPPKKLVHTWLIRYDPAFADEVSRVTWLIEQRGTLCKLTLQHDVTDAPRTGSHVSVDGWPLILSGIKTLLETGDVLVMGAV